MRPSRPVALHAPAVLVAGFGVMVFVLARTTGSGWLVVIGVGLVPVLLVGVAAPALAVVRAHPTLRTPRDATVRRSVRVRAAFGGRARGLRFRLLEPLSGWVRVDAPASGEFLATPSRRGVLQAVTVELASAAPLGFVSWRRRARVALDLTLEVGPAPIQARGDARAINDRHSAAASTGAARGDDTVRGVRAYVAGDPLRLVHWPATARWGRVMVREHDEPRPDRLVLAVDLSPRPGTTAVDVEEVAGRAAGVVADALARDRPVMLATAETGGPVAAEVATTVEAGRRLARAVAGPPAEPGLAPGDEAVRLRVTGEDRGNS